jgi:hypothetical protein
LGDLHGPRLRGACSSGARIGKRETGLGEAGSDSERRSPFDRIIAAPISVLWG